MFLDFSFANTILLENSIKELIILSLEEQIGKSIPNNRKKSN